jgi:hypothetical protein
MNVGACPGVVSKELCKKRFGSVIVSEQNAVYLEFAAHNG